MKDAIKRALFGLERERGIHVVNARLRGSRMMRSAHPESDWDVLFLFAQDCANYVTINGYIDSIHSPELGDNGNVDLHGWNIDKFAGLVADSNPNAVEYCRPDPTEYVTFYPDSFDALTEEVRQNFNRMSLYYHYISMGKRNWKKYVESGKETTATRQFHVARAIAMAQFIRQNDEYPPMDVRLLWSDNAVDDELSELLRNLTTSRQMGLGDEELDDRVGEFYLAESETEMEPTDDRIRSPDTNVIDRFLRDAVVR